MSVTTWIWTLQLNFPGCQYSCCSALCSCPGDIVRIYIVGPQGTAPKCQIRSFWWIWLRYPYSSPVSKSASWRIQGSLNQWDGCLRSFQFWRVQYGLTDKFWGSERSRAAALKWISLKCFEDHHVLSKEIEPEHEQWPGLTLPCLLWISPSAAGTAWDSVDWDFCLSGASFKIKVLKKDDSWQRVQQIPSEYFFAFRFLLESWFRNVPFDLDLDGSLLAI